MRYWWVNQNATFRHEVPGGFLWSPKHKSNGHRNHYYETMLEAQPGDVVFSFAQTEIKAIGVVRRSAIETPKPDFGTAGQNWSNTGWFLEVEFQVLEHPFRPKDYIEQIRSFLPKQYSPLISESGNGIQSVYLTEIPKAMAEILEILSRQDLARLRTDLSDVNDEESEEIIKFEISARNLEGDLEQVQLVKARRGQGIFRANVRLYETECRITHVRTAKHLRASHIKPWSKSSDAEKLHGANGLLLAPHVDHLFDRGFISFSNKGDLIASPKLNPRVLEKWSIALPQNVGKFHTDQEPYLEYHRDVVLPSAV